MKKQFKIQAVFTMIGSYTVEANSLEEAKEKIAHNDLLGLPENGYYLDDSFEIDDDGCFEILQ